MATSPAFDDPPLSIEPVLGWRAWTLRRVGGVLTLGSLTRPDTWPPGEVMEARCTRHREATVPIQGCTCGLYAAATPKDLAHAGVLGTSVSVVGAIAMWGTVVEHQRGARSGFAYPARLRLVCGPCLYAGAGAVDPVRVFDRGGALAALCKEHESSVGGSAEPADEVQAELLATYGVEVMPIERIDRDLRNPGAAARSIAKEPVRLVGLLVAGVGKLLGALFMLWALSGLLFVGLALVFGVYQFVGRVVGFVPPEATPVVAVVPPVPAPPLVEPWSPPAPAGPIVSDFPDRGVDHELVAFPPFAVVCGTDSGTRIDIVPCTVTGALLGWSERSAPHGPKNDCIGRWDAYAHGRSFWICWEDFFGTSDAGRWVHSPNPWSIPVDDGGAIHEHR